MTHLMHDLEAELSWLSHTIGRRFQAYFELGDELVQIAPPDLSDSAYGAFVQHHGFSSTERLALALALAPQIQPQMLDVFFTRNKTYDRRFTEFGGDYNTAASGFIPTGDTLAFILGGGDIAARLDVLAIFGPDHTFAKQHILYLDTHSGEAQLTGRLLLTPDARDQMLFGERHTPTFSPNFPAQRVKTALTWEDLVLHPGTLKQVEDVAVWLRHGQTLLYEWEMVDRLRPGYRSLFYGPPGTGKTMTACLLGQSSGYDVYKIDLSLVVSKYIGETEKNLALVFEQAQHRQWILFFDEADALFGKRSDTRDAHDRYANQEVAYLLQRIETFDGVAILASNRRDNLDEAFTRRFESMIYFPAPRPVERLRLWQNGFSTRSDLAADVDLTHIAETYTLTGGEIMNVIRYASLDALQRGHTHITAEALLTGIHREHAKAGRST